MHNVACEYIGIDDLCNMNLAVYTKRGTNRGVSVTRDGCRRKCHCDVNLYEGNLMV